MTDNSLMELVEEYGFECLHSGDDEQRILFEIRAKVQALERDAARHAHIISRITQSELETVIRRKHDDDDEYTAFLIQMLDAAMEAANVPER